MPREPLPYTPGVAGVDEVGRGALAGPVVVAAVILPPEFDTIGIIDSKALSAAQREEAAERIRAEARYTILFASAEEIDAKNVLRATLDAMRESLIQLKANEAIIDGNQLPPGLPCPATTLVKGDSKDASIAAASILAKVARDNHMVEMADNYPGYGFEGHVGYGAPSHLGAIKSLGPCPIHRKSFEPIKSLINQPCLTLDL
ncbi:MAG: ribonuclease HII [Armatimonadetes bacterium]|nr:ribonuclease HII [Armatimonadota bacterium]